MGLSLYGLIIIWKKSMPVLPPVMQLGKQRRGDLRNFVQMCEEAKYKFYDNFLNISRNLSKYFAPL